MSQELGTSRTRRLTVRTWAMSLFSFRRFFFHGRQDSCGVLDHLVVSSNRKPGLHGVRTFSLLWFLLLSVLLSSASSLLLVARRGSSISSHKRGPDNAVRNVRRDMVHTKSIQLELEKKNSRIGFMMHWKSQRGRSFPSSVWVCDSCRHRLSLCSPLSLSLSLSLSALGSS